ncbi:AMP-binding protein [Roseibium porphyridii]|uniref:AMP-binding protein n=1 Tax=Roseibium porphyridii TaxID=2866279 RepID=A0ABY8F4Y3_9HYPH|nr:AMP-binding protein [Roseibium sp. KMA01]WFE90421.1 AMP-binding protein [Roseibium sp. KMA01]
MLEPAGDYETLNTRFQWSLPATYNMAAAISDVWAAKDPERLAIRQVLTNGDVRDWSHQRLNQAANRIANAFVAKGIRRGDRVALLLPQVPETAVAHLAAYKIGAIAVPLAALFGLEALRYRLSDSGAKALVTDSAGLEKLSQIREDLPDLDLVVSTDGPQSGVCCFDDLQAKASDRFETIASTPDDPALMIYTSGTTGQPKGVLHGHRVLFGHMPGIELSQNFLGRDGDFLWTPADWAWAGGLLNALFPALTLGVPVLSHATRKFDPEFAFKLLEREGVRNAFIPPTALKMLRAVDSPARRFNLAWRSVGSAGESLGRETYDWFQGEFGFAVNEFYGQTECNAVLGSVAELGVSRSGAIGKAIPGHAVAIIDDTGMPLPPETLGQIAVKRPDPVMFLEYWNKPEATRDKFIDDWMITGDQGVMDEDGYVHFVGRDDDIITSASYRIGPGEIEDCLIKHPSIALAAAIGKPDSLRTEIVKAYVVLKPDAEGGEQLEDDIRGFVRERLSAHEYPREIEFVDELPMTTTGKVIRRKLRQQARDEISVRA